MNDGRLPEVPATWLRDHGTHARVERVWKRLRRDVTPRSTVSKGKGMMWWAPVAFASVFGAGVLVGATWMSQAPSTTALMPEPQGVAEPVAAGEREAQPSPEADQSEPVPEPRRATRGRAPVVTVEPSEPIEEALPTVAQVVVAPAPVPEYQRLSNLGEYAKAWQAVEALGGFDVVLKSANAEQLMMLVDIARATGRRGRAVQVLRRVTQEFPADPNAPIAAMTLGNMLHQAGDYAGAAAAYELNRRLSPDGDFAEDALARQFETAAEQGELEQARKLAEQYARDFPDGRRGEAIMAELARLEAEAGKQEEPGVSDAASPGAAPTVDSGAE